MAYREQGVVNDAQAYKIMAKAAELGLMVNVHAENALVINERADEYLRQGKVEVKYHAESRPPQLEAEATGRAIALAELTGAAVYIVHVSCAQAMEQILEARRRGVKVYAETCPQYVVLDESCLELPDGEAAKYVCVPPLREKWHQEELWDSMRAGFISVVGSDHCPFRYEEKLAQSKRDFTKIPNGLPGIEDRFLMMYEYGVHAQRITLQTFVDVMCTKPAKLFGLTKKGALQIGYDADIVLLDPRRSTIITWEHQKQQLDYNLFEGTKVHAAITHVFSRGELIVHKGDVVGESGRGRYLHRKAHQ